METLTTLLLFVLGILNFLLFFKIWGMTNDIRKIKEKYLNQKYIVTEAEYTNKQKEDIESRKSGSKFKLGDLVIIKKDESQFSIGKVEEKEGTFYYSSENRNNPGEYTDGEIELFDVYWGK